jgi:diguanylate cyclase (GGDEF)-like protein
MGILHTHQTTVGNFVRRFSIGGAQVYDFNTEVLEQVGLRRAVEVVTSICVTGTAVAAVWLALAGMSTVPAMCVCLSLPAFVWGMWYSRRKPVTYIASLCYVTYCDVAITAGIFLVTTSSVGFIKLAWLAATTAYALIFHGKVAMWAQAAVTVFATTVAIVGAVLRDDSTVPVLAIAVAPVILGDLIAGWVIFASKTQFTRQADRAHRLARHDHLTGLLNRRGLQDACDTWIGSLTNRTVAVAVLDLNDLKPVNDTHGHHVGDQILQRTAQRLVAAAGASALVARLGGDEFAVAADVDSHDISDFIESIKECMNDHHGVVGVSASIGFATAPGSDIHAPGGGTFATVVATLLHDADAEMYRAKKAAQATTTVTAATPRIERRRPEQMPHRTD